MVVTPPAEELEELTAVLSVGALDSVFCSDWLFLGTEQGFSSFWSRDIDHFFVIPAAAEDSELRVLWFKELEEVLAGLSAGILDTVLCGVFLFPAVWQGSSMIDCVPGTSELF